MSKAFNMAWALLKQGDPMGDPMGVPQQPVPQQPVPQQPIPLQGYPLGWEDDMIMEPPEPYDFDEILREGPPGGHSVPQWDVGKTPEEAHADWWTGMDAINANVNQLYPQLGQYNSMMARNQVADRGAEVDSDWYRDNPPKMGSTGNHIMDVLAHMAENPDLVAQVDDHWAERMRNSKIDDFLDWWDRDNY